MNLLFDLLKIVLPAALVFITAFLLIKNFTETQIKLKKRELVQENSKHIMPVRLQAYERIIMFLERISPDSIVMRYTQQVKTAKELQTSLLESIRAEYEHNLSQQIYVSSRAWEMVKGAKGNLIKLINSVAENVDDRAPALNLSQAILEKIMEVQKSPVYDAIEYVKKEVQDLMK